MQKRKMEKGKMDKILTGPKKPRSGEENRIEERKQ
jgi:hypothetical protein